MNTEKFESKKENTVDNTVIEMGYESRNTNLVVGMEKIEIAEQAESFTTSRFGNLVELEAEIEKALEEIKKLNGMENFSTSQIRFALGSKLGSGALRSSTLGAAAILGMPCVGIPLGIASLFGFSFFGKKPIEALANNQKELYEIMIKISRVQVLLFEFQRVAAEILNELFDMCTSNVEVVETTIKTLKKSLSGSESSLTETTKKEIRDLIKKLMARKDSMMKQNDMEQEIKQLKKENKEIKQMLQTVIERH